MWRPRSASVFLAVGFLAVWLVQCEQPRRSTPSTQNSSVASVTRQPAKTEDVLPPPLLTSAPPDPALTFTHPPANTLGCPDGMVRVTGAYCPGVIQTCEEYHE